MNYKTWLKVSVYALLLGWFPFMLVSIWASWNREYGLIVLLIGLGICMFASMMILPLLKNEDLFKSIEELEKERILYYGAKRKLEQKIIEL